MKEIAYRKKTRKRRKNEEEMKKEEIVDDMGIGSDCATNKL